MSIIRAERIQGMMPADYLQWLAEQARFHKRIVEIGSYRGRSTTALCEHCPGTVTAVDTWRGSPGVMNEMQYMQGITGDPDWLFNEFLYNMAGFENLKIIRKPSLEAAMLFAREKRQFDFIFIDGLHDYENVRADISTWFHLLDMDGGTICGHDYQFPAVKKAVREIFPLINDGVGDMWVINTSVEVPA